MEKILYIIRGIPGSGKSTLAHKLTDNVVEADQFFMVNGEYKWEPKKLHWAHSMCKRTVEDYMIEGRDKIAVANTFIKRKEVQPYINLAKEYGYKVIQKVCKGNYGSIHNVPEETMNRMRNTFQDMELDEEVYRGYETKLKEEGFLVNPSKNELKKFISKTNYQEARGILTINSDTLYIFNAENITHDDFVSYMNINEPMIAMIVDDNLLIRSNFPDNRFSDDYLEYLMNNDKIQKSGIEISNRYADEWEASWNEDLEESFYPKMIAYHGSQTTHLKMNENSMLYFTTDYDNAASYAKREWDEGLIEGEIPVIYTAELYLKNPMDMNDFDSFCTTFLEEDKEEIIEQGYDSVHYHNKKTNVDFYVVFYPNQFKIIGMDKLPKSHKYYYPKDGGIDPDDVDEYYYDDDEIQECLKLAGVKND